METTTFQNRGENQLENLEDLYPLSPMQQGMLFHSIYSPHSGDYFEQSLFTIKGDLNFAAFEGAWQRVLDRHSILRTSFIWEELEKPLQVVYRQVDLPLARHDWRNLSAEEQQLQLESFIKEDRSRGFLLNTAPLIRLALFQFADNEYKFIFSRHHVVLDRWSRALLLKDLFATYHALADGREPSLSVTRPYVDYITWLGRQDANAAERFWRDSLAGFTEPTSLVIGGGSPQTIEATERYTDQRIQLSEETTARLTEFARQHRLTLNTLVQGAWALLLSRYTGKDDILFGATVAGRPAELAGVESMVGLFINTLPVRVRVPSSMTTLSWLQGLQTQQGELQQFEYSSLLDVQGWSDVARGVSLFESILVFENLPVGSSSKAVHNSVEFRDERGAGSTTGYPLTLYVHPGRKLAVKIVYDLTRYTDEAIDNLLLHFQTLFENLPASAETLISQLPLLTQSEQRQILIDWNNTHTNFEQLSVVELFERQAASMPFAIAVSCRDRQLTYAELNARANQLARRLRSVGVGPEIVVGICIERSLEMVVGLLGILKAGGAYLPLDPALPKERLAFMMEDAGVTAVVTLAALSDDVPPHHAKVVALDADIFAESSDNPDTAVVGENLAYVMYTSGSTGRPKGVQVSHSALANFLNSMRAGPGISASDVLLSVTTLSFDIAGLEIYLPLTVGAQVVIASREVARDGAALARLISQSGATIMQATPATWRLLIDSGWKGDAKLRVLCGGEALSRDLASQLIQRGAELWNLYGPTETTIWSTIKQISSPVDQVTIGKPIANTQIYILDQRLQPVPVGVAGELYIGGQGVARGYVNRPDLTADKFVPDPFATGRRLYQTGDSARYLADGNTEYLGRLDDQVKIRGFRVELGEIESVLSQCPGVKAAVAIVRTDSANDDRLVAYVVPEAAGVNSKELRDYLRKKLPEYMVPAAIVEIERMPLTPNGKIDRRALPAPQLLRSDLEAQFASPRTPTEEILTSLWSEVLKVDEIGIHDNFFNLGGHSLLAVQLVSRIRVAFGTELPLAVFFESPTVAACAERIEETMRDAEKLQRPPLTRASREGDLPLSFSQQRLWFLNQLEGDSGFYNMPIARRLRGRLDVEALRKSLESITMRHEALRTNFKSIDGNPVQVIRDTPGLVLSVIDLSYLQDVDQEYEIKRLGEAEAVLPFDLSRDPLLRVRLVLLGDEDSVLLVTMHHIVSDGWSLEVLWRELSALYEEFTLGTPSRLSDLPIQYVDYSEWQREWLESETMEKQLSYWREQLHGIPSVLELPKDRPRPAVQNYRGRLQSLVVSPVLAQQVSELSRREGVTLFTTLLAALQTLLWRYTGQDDVVVGSPVANRSQPEIEGLIGFFVNTLVLRSNLSGSPTFRELLDRVKQVVLRALANQDLPFERLVDELQPERSLSRTPLFQVNFTLQNARPAFALTGLQVERLSVGRTTSKFDLTLTAFERPNYLSLTVEYNTDLFDDSRMTRMLGHYQTLLEAIVADPETKISQLPILTDSEREQLVADWNQTATTYGKECVHELFSEQAKRVPHAPAVLFKDTQLSYDEVDQRANQLARFLRKRGVAAETLVGICVERSTEMVIGLLGILKAGGAYLPLDPSHPQELLSYMLRDAHASILLTQQSLKTNLPESADVTCLDSDWEAIAEESSSAVHNIGKPDNLAYVIYTSGSTGKPRGVMVTHRGLSNYLNWCTKAYGVAEGSGPVVHSPLGFDLTITSLLAPLVCGQRVNLLREDDGIEELGQALSGGKDHSLVKLTPSHLEGLSHLLPRNAAGKTRALIIGGEALFGERVSFWRTVAPETRIINEYGPTETVVGCCVYEVAGGQSSGPVPIGKPIANTHLYVLDDNFEMVPVGVPGELYIGGVGVARGYVNHPELTAEKFIPDPFSGKPGERLYRSGDLVRYLADGNLEYIGRRDHQVKLRGYRIELGEIEAVLNSHPQVREAVVLAREDEPGNKQLVGYVSPYTDELGIELTSDFETEQVSEWEEVFNESYAQTDEPADPKFNLVGWNSSYTGEPIPAPEMREWVERTVERILSLHPKRVLEIGCGSGLLLSRIAPNCEHYHGTDLSQAALNYVRKHFPVSNPEFAGVTLSNDLNGLKAGSFDTIVLNSVVQYFPTADYLVKLLKKAVRLLKPDGSIFLGDLRSLPLQKAFHTSLQLHDAAEEMTVHEFRVRVERQMDQEKELVIDPAFFMDLRRQIPELAAVDVQLKRAHYPNELSKFRYDVILRVRTKPVPQVRTKALHWQRDGLDLESLRSMLADEGPDALVIREVPNALLASESKTLELLNSEDGPQTAGELRRAVQRLAGEPAVSPEDVYALADELPYSVQLRSSGGPNYGSVDVILRRKDTPYAEVVSDEETAQPGQYTNNPLRTKLEQSLLLDLRKMLRQKLPEHMAPSEFVFLTTLPLTSNGKIDRNALPAPDRLSSQFRSFEKPRNDTERQLADIWAEILRRKEVGINDNFFNLGGHSLLATQVISRVRQRFNIEFPLRRLFEFPTIAELAEAVDEAQKEGKAHSELQIKVKQRDRSALLDNIDNLSAEQIDTLLSEVLSKVNANQ